MKNLCTGTKSRGTSGGGYACMEGSKVIAKRSTDIERAAHTLSEVVLSTDHINVCVHACACLCVCACVCLLEVTKQQSVLE